MSLTSLSVDQILDIWTELSEIWYKKINEDNPNYGFQFYAWRIMPQNPNIDRMVELHGPVVEKWIKNTLDPQRSKQAILKPWGGLAELCLRFEREHSTNDYHCEIYINDCRVGDWVGKEMLELWRCDLKIRCRVTAASKA